jgi:hypothetical protein
MYTHTFHFSNYEEMDHCHSMLDQFITVQSSTTNEFDGDAANEVVCTTAKPIPQTAIKKMNKYFAPKDVSYNVEAA